MSNVIAQYIDEIIASKEMSEIEEADKIRFSVNIDNIDNRRLEFIVKKLEVKKTAFVREIVKLAINEAEKKLGLSVNPKVCPEYYKVIFKSERRKVTLPDGQVVKIEARGFGELPDESEAE
jgi:predicted DNA-binding protein